MNIGIAMDVRRGERRVALRPSELGDLVRRKHRILVERGAGLGVGISDAEYVKAGAISADTRQVYSCPLVVKLREPNVTELRMMRPGAFVFSMMHFLNRSHLPELLREHRINAIAMERLKNPLGERLIEDLHEVGYSGMMKGLELWGRDPRRATVKIMGCGKIAFGAIQAASRKQARVILLSKRENNEMHRHLPGTDILVDALTWPSELRGKVYLVTRSMLRLMRPGAAVIGLTANPAWKYPIETMRPTTLEHISYKFQDIIHAACWGWSGLDPVNVTRRYSLQIAPVLSDIARSGLKRLPEYIKCAMFGADK